MVPGDAWFLLSNPAVGHTVPVHYPAQRRQTHLTARLPKNNINFKYFFPQKAILLILHTNFLILDPKTGFIDLKIYSIQK